MKENKHDFEHVCNSCSISHKYGFNYQTFKSLNDDKEGTKTREKILEIKKRIYDENFFYCELCMQLKPKDEKYHLCDNLEDRHCEHAFCRQVCFNFH